MAYPKSVALITGAGSAQGIGFATAKLLAQAGIAIAITSTTARIHDRAHELRQAGFNAFSVEADLTDWSAVTHVVHETLATFGHLEILINNAGMTQVGTAMGDQPVETLSLEEWEQGLARNATTAFLCCKAVLPVMKAQRYGRIVNVASVTGPVVTNPFEAAYAAGKAAMVGLTRTLALETATWGITVNAVAPGWIATASSTPEEHHAARYSPVGRAGTPEEVASAIRWLAAPEASYVTGQILIVDGGNSLMENKAPSLSLGIAPDSESNET
ncbi:MAG: short-chain dehydrogenase [Sulfobacillus thermosulfidooxidans]|nr:MAG: short-chain dehydrogenase [Sulfobacillus thermosulfidooxidans]